MTDLYQSALSIASESLFIKHNYVSQRSWSLSYLRYRCLRPLLKVYNRLLNIGYGKYRPWLSPASIKILVKNLSKEMKGLEFGSGMSTYFISKLIGELVSIEHHPQWYRIVKKKLEKNRVSNLTYKFIQLDILESKAEICQRYNQPFEEENTLYKSYYEFVESFPDNQFDFILIDGRARVECCRRSLPKLKAGGILLVDNSERERYKPIHDMLKDWSKIMTTTGLTDTTLWFKP